MGISGLCVSSPGKCPIQTSNSGVASDACSSVQTLIPSTQVKIHTVFLHTKLPRNELNTAIGNTYSSHKKTVLVNFPFPPAPELIWMTVLPLMMMMIVQRGYPTLIHLIRSRHLYGNLLSKAGFPDNGKKISTSWAKSIL